MTRLYSVQKSGCHLLVSVRFRREVLAVWQKRERWKRERTEEAEMCSCLFKISPRVVLR